jgi:3-isopropylmalate dehydrogenase
MATHKLLLLPGDGIGPEVMAEVKRLIAWLNAQGIAHFETEQGLVGGSAYDAHEGRDHRRSATMAKAMAADAVIFGAVGGPKWDSVPYEVRPKPACCACARISACSPICARRCAIRRWRMPPA